MATVRRIFDVLASLAALIILFPVFLAIAAWVKLDSPGATFFCQRRVGRGAREFTLYKFRTMWDSRLTQLPQVAAPKTFEDAEFRRDFCCGRCASPLPDCACVTRAGRFLRKTSLDELPQLWNIVCGHMTFVGPRPTLRNQVELYSSRQRKRLMVKPGMTGLAQVSGRNQITWDKKIALDLWYIEHRSLWLDCKIVFRTLVGG